MSKRPRVGIALAGAAVVISAAAAVISIARSVRPASNADASSAVEPGGCKGCGSGEGGDMLAALVEGMSDLAAERMTRMETEIARRPRATLDDAQYLHECAHGFDDVAVQRWAIALASERIVAKRCEPDAIETMESVIVDALYHDNWRVRRTALATAQECGLTARSDIVERVRAMRNDEHPEVAVRASFVPLPGDAPPNGG